MVIKLTNDDPEFPIYLQSDAILAFSRAPGSRKTQVITTVQNPGGPMAWLVQEEPEVIAQLLTRGLLN